MERWLIKYITLHNYSYFYIYNIFLDYWYPQVKVLSTVNSEQKYFTIQKLSLPPPNLGTSFYYSKVIYS